MKAPSCCRFSWKIGGISIGVLSLILAFPVSTSGDLSVSLHFLIVSGCLLYGIYAEKPEFLLPYLVELVIILIQCVISFIGFMLLKPYDNRDIEGDVVNDLFYDEPNHLSSDEKRFIQCALVITSIVIVFFWSVTLALYRRMRYCKTVDDNINTIEIAIPPKA